MGADAPSGASTPYRPSIGRPFAWPDAFGTRFAVFVDTEEEFDWSKPLSRDARSVTATRAIPEAHGRFADRGVALTFLVDHPVASDPASVAIIRATFADGRSTVGTQLHPWVNPPHEEAVTGPNSFVGNLPLPLQAAKLDLLTDLIAEQFGRRPLIYRAGRYGIGPDTWRLLAERGYLIDSSLRARYDYRAECGPDFRQVGNEAFVTPERLLELPLTTALTGIARSRRLYEAFGKLPRGQGVASRLKLVARVPLTPEGVPLREALEAIRAAQGEGLRLLNFAFHSPSLVPGNTPYVRDAADLRSFWLWWDGVLDLLAQRGIANASLDEMLSAVGAAVGPAGLEPAT